MAGPVEIVQLEPHDDVTSVRDRLAFVKANRVLLVWPPAGCILSRKLDLVLLQREARRRAARLALVTRDPEVIANAQDLNISVFESIEHSRRSAWKRGRSKVFVDRADRPESDPAPEDLRDVVSRLRPELTPSQRTLRQAARVAALALGCVLILSALYFLIPSATVTLTPVRERLDITIRVFADPTIQTINLANSAVPATVLRVEIEESAETPATGSLDEPPTLARGSVVFTNRDTQAITIPAGTTVSTSAGVIVRFRTLEAVDIAGEAGAIAVAAIEALPDFAGPQGNVPANAIDHLDGPLADSLAVQNPEPTSGGSDPEVTVVTQDDHDRLLAMVRQAIQQRAWNALTPLLGEGQEIIPETIGIVEERDEWTTFSATIGDATNTVALTMRAAVQAIVVDYRLVNQVAFAGLGSRIPPGKIVVPDTMRFERGPVEAIDAAGRVALLNSVSSDVVTAVDTEALRQALAGRSIEDARRYLIASLALDPLAPPQIALWPDFLGQMPALPARISIIVWETP